MEKIRTSTQISIKFTIFTVFTLFFFWTTLNLYFFYSWYDSEKIEISDNISNLYNSSCDYKLNWKANLVKLVLNKWGYIRDKDNRLFISSEYKTIPKTDEFWFFERDNIHYFAYWRYIDWIGEVVLFSVVTPYFHDQIFLFNITLIFLIIFWIITLPISLYFTKSSLVDLNKIAKFAKGLDFNNLSKTIDISGKHNDEIKIVADALNSAIKKIDTKAKRLKEFTWDVAHEFKTPLMSINSEIDYALKSKHYKPSLLNIKIQVKALDDIVVSLLSFARLESEKVDFKNENIKEIIYWVFVEIENIYKDKNLLAELKLVDDVFKKVDRNLFSVAIKNLIWNAFRYTQSWKIEIELNNEKLVISDTWKWIAKENLSKIFERFYKEDISRNDQTSHWLWLSLTKEILEKHKFKIEVESEPWVGSKFIIYF